MTVTHDQTTARMAPHDLQKRIANKEATIGVVGLGYVGLPVACAFAAAGFRVLGVDIKAQRVRQINDGENPIEGQEPGLAPLLAAVAKQDRLRACTDYQVLREADVVLIDVETPVDDEHKPRYEALRAVCGSLGPVLIAGALVIVESTVAPGTTTGLVGPLLERSGGGRVNEDFLLGVCPERVMPGKLLSNLRTMSRICGGATPQTAEIMADLYAHIVDADLDMADPLTAELVKTAENAYRDVQIAFANEVALICEAAGGDVWRVRQLVNKSPGRQMLYPGAGVGGHCIPKDPWLLAHGATGRVPLRLVPAARAVNDGMPLHMARMTVQALDEAGVSIEGARVLVLGYAYLENSGDTRNSPSEPFVQHMRRLGAEVVLHDPWVEAHQGDVQELAQGCDAVVIMVAHDAYRELNLAQLKKVMRNGVLVDGRLALDKESAHQSGFVYRAVGQGRGGEV